jgi:DNA repair exonuclease SbcCD ATPase subunit
MADKDSELNLSRQLTERLKNDTDFQKMYQEHYRRLELLARLPEPTEEQKRIIGEEIEKLKRDIEESAQRREEDEERIAEQLKRKRENDPKYWRGLYEGLLRRIEAEREQKQEDRRTLTIVLTINAFVFILFGLLKWLRII